MFFDAASKGMFQRSELRNRQRKELAQAFQQFKQANPEATLAEFQMFIDNMAGSGQNYVRGGAPSGQVLQQLANDNSQRKQRRLQQEAAADLRSRAESMGYYEGLADKAVMNMSGEDFDGAYTDFMSGLGPNAEQVLNGMNLRNRFTTQRRERLQQDRLRQMFPEINNYLATIGYDVDKINAADISAIFQVPESQVGIFVDAANTQARIKQDELARGMNADIMRVGEQAALRGEDPEAAVRNYLTNSPYAWMADKYDYTDVKNHSARVVQEREDAAENESAQRVEAMRLAWDENRTLQEAWQMGDRETALATMLRIAKINLNPRDFERIYGVTPGSDPTAALFEDELTTMTESRRARQDDAYFTKSRELQSTLSTEAAGYASQNREQFVDVLKNYFPDEVAGTLGDQLGQSYSARNPTTINTILETVSSDEFKSATEGNPARAVQYVREALQSAGIQPDLTTARDAYIQDRQDDLGMFKRSTFQDWMKEESSDMLADFDQYRQTFDSMLTTYADNPQVLASQLMRLNQAVQQSAQARAREMEAREVSKTDWIYWNSGGWDDALVNDQILRVSERETEALQRTIQDAIASARQRANEQPDPASDPLPPVPEGGGDSAFSEWLDGVSNEMDRSAALNRVMTDAGMKSSPVSFFTQDQETRDYYGMVNGFLQDRQVMGYLTTHPDQFEAFMRASQDGDPQKYIRESEVGQQWMQREGY